MTFVHKRREQRCASHLEKCSLVSAPHPRAHKGTKKSAHPAIFSIHASNAQTNLPGLPPSCKPTVHHVRPTLWLTKVFPKAGITPKKFLRCTLRCAALLRTTSAALQKNLERGRNSTIVCTMPRSRHCTLALEAIWLRDPSLIALAVGVHTYG